MIYAEGNNREAVKIKRISIPIQDDAGISNYARYYLPELPEINKGKVVGIQSHFTIGSAGQPEYVSVPVINWNNQPGVNFPTASGKNMTLNLVNNEDILIIENFPLLQLTGYTNTVNNDKQKIVPFDIKINSKKSYIYYFPLTAPSSTVTFYVNLTFFYVE
jgi:hypothetical protein